MSTTHRRSQTMAVWRALAATAAILMLLPVCWPEPGGTLAQEKKVHSQEQKPEKADDEDPVVTLRADLVLVNITVTDAGGQYVHGLKARDFVLLDDDTPQTVTSFSTEVAPFAAAILIDMSGSMEYKFGLVRGAAGSFIEHIRDDDQVAVYGFNTKIRQIQDFTNLRDIADAVWDAKAEDRTRLYDCMDESITALAGRPEKRRAVLVISDGWDNQSQKATMESAMKRALAAGVVIYSIDLIDDDGLMGTGQEAIMLRKGRSDLREFAAQTGGRYVHSPKGTDLEDAFTNIVDELRNQYTLTFYPTNKKHDGRWRKLTVSTRNKDQTVRARRGYYAPKN